MRLLICGSRTFDDYPMILRAFNGIRLVHGLPDYVIEGECRGADLLGKAAAMANGVPLDRILTFQADWGVYGRAAGPIRNHDMLHEGQPTHGLCFAKDFTQWSGTLDMARLMDAAGVPLACLSTREHVELWRDHGCPFGPLSSWLPAPQGVM